MKKSATLIAVALSALMTSAVGRAQQTEEAKPEPEEAKPEAKDHAAQFCTAMSAFNTDYASLQALTSKSSMADLRKAAASAMVDVKAMNDAASDMDTPAAKDFTQSVKGLGKTLRDDIQEMPGSMTIAEAKTKLSADMLKVKEGAKKLAAESNCPGA